MTPTPPSCRKPRIDILVLDSIAGQMTAMRGGKVTKHKRAKKGSDDSSDDDESDTDGEVKGESETDTETEDES
jgi:translocation protein SEC63